MENVVGYKTAMNRKALSAPMVFLQEKEYLTGDCLDYGCGKGYDAKVLGIDSFDPFYKPEKPGKLYNTITCNYVFNVLEPEKVDETMIAIQALLKDEGIAFISVRNDIKGESQKGKDCIQYNRELELPLVKKNGNFRMYLLTKNNY
jgi:hypothetical protein